MLAWKQRTAPAEAAPQDGRQSQRRVAQGGGRRDGGEKVESAPRQPAAVGEHRRISEVDRGAAQQLQARCCIAAASATADGAYSCEERARARRALEETLLSTPLRAASIKYDGTCFGKLDTGELVGRKQTLGAACAESNDPTCGGNDDGTGVMAAAPPRRPPPPRA